MNARGTPQECTLYLAISHWTRCTLHVKCALTSTVRTCGFTALYTVRCLSLHTLKSHTNMNCFFFFNIVLYVYDVRLKRCTLRQTFVHSKFRTVNCTLKFVLLRVGHTSLEMNVGLGKAPAKA